MCLKTPKRCIFWGLKKAKMAALKLQKVTLSGARKCQNMLVKGPFQLQKGLLNIRCLKSPKRCNFRYHKKPKQGYLRPLLTPKRLHVPENSKKVHFLVPEKTKMASLKTLKTYIIWGHKMPKCVSLRPLFTPKRPLNFQVPKNSKKAKIQVFKAPFTLKRLQVSKNSKKVHFLVPEKA